MSAVDLRDARSAEIPEREEAFLASLDGPTMLRVPGRDRSRVRAVAAMLHGNEPSGFRAVHDLLRNGERPAVDLLCFVGAVEAARAAPVFSHRMLPGRRDLNRCFHPPWEGVDGAVAREVLDMFREARVEALVDLHNNSGHNPPYSIATVVTSGRLGLASLFADRVVHSALRLGSLMEAFDASFPIVTVECGRAGEPDADRVAREGLQRYATADALPDGAANLTLFGDAIRVMLRPGARVAFCDSPHANVELTLDANVDRHNFTRLPAGTRIGWLGKGAAWPLVAMGADGREVSQALFEPAGRALVTARSIVPVMMTTDPQAAAGDCLFYVVREVV